IEALPHQLEGNKGDRNGDRDYQSRDYRGSPVAQKNNQNDRRENQAEYDRVSHALDRIAHDNGLVVKWPNINARGQRLANLVHLRVNFIGHLDGITVGLAIDVQQHSWLTIRG